MTKLAVIIAVILCVAGGCWRTSTPDPPPIPGEVVLETLLPEKATAATAPAEKPKSDLDVDKIASNPWVIAGVFLAIQWFEIWYFNRTGRKSATIDAAEAAMQPKLGVVQRVLYWVWRRVYFWKHRDQKDPDKEEEKHK